MGLNKKTAGLLLGGVLGTLFFFSGTLYRYKLPEVRGVKPFRGTLNKREISYGITGREETDKIYARLNGIASAVFVKEGDTVRAGQALFAVEYDTEETERKLRELRNNQEKLRKDLDYTAGELASLNRVLRAFENGDAQNDGEYREDLIGIELNKARLALEEAELSYRLGGKSRRDTEAARDTVAALYLTYKAAQRTLGFEVEAKSLDLRNLELQEEAYLGILGDYRDYGLIPAAAEGVIVSLAVKEGMYIREGELMVSLAPENEFVLTCAVAWENNFILPGDSCRLSNASHALEGTVSLLTPAAEGKLVKIALASAEVSPGETFEVTFEKKSAAVYTLVPNAAVNQDRDGYFLNQIKRRRGILGEEYYAERLDVYIGDSDLDNTAVTWGIVFFEPLIVRSNRTVVSGNALSLINPEDFFEY
jgi:hypothetical protein